MRDPKILRCVVLTALLLTGAGGLEAADPPGLAEELRFPVLLLPNRGQWEDGVLAMTLPGRSRVIFRDDGILFLRERKERIMDLPGENPAGEPEDDGYDRAFLRFAPGVWKRLLTEGDERVTRVQFYVGEREHWREQVPALESVTYREVFDGVDLTVRTTGASLRLELDGMSPGQFLAHSTIEGDRTLADDLLGVDCWKAVVQESVATTSAGSRTSASSVHDSLRDSVRFRMPDRYPNGDSHYWTEFTTLFFGKNEANLDTFDGSCTPNIHVDRHGRFTFAGMVYRAGLPTTPNAYQKNLIADGPRIELGLWHHFFGRFRCDGITPDYLTYFGMEGRDLRTAMDQAQQEIHNNRVYTLHGLIESWSTERDHPYYPITAGALERRYAIDSMRSMYLACFDTTGMLAYGSRLNCIPGQGGGASYRPLRIGHDDHVYICGDNVLRELPYVSPGVFQDTATVKRSFLMKLTPDCDSVVYCTYLPETTQVVDVGADAEGYATLLAGNKGHFPMKNAFQPVCKEQGDFVIARFSPAGDSLVFSTYLGGDFLEGHAGYLGYTPQLLVTPSGESHVVSITRSEDFPLHRPLQTTYRYTGFGMHRESDLVLAGFAADGSILYSTYWGGLHEEYPLSLNLTPCGTILISGSTNSPDFPVCNPTAFSTRDTSGWRQFVMLFDPVNVRVRSMYMQRDSGHSWLRDADFDPTGHMYMLGAAQFGFDQYNGYLYSPEDHHYSATLSRMHFPLCGEDLPLGTAGFRDTILVDSVRGFISHGIFDLRVLLRNPDTLRPALRVRSRIKLPPGLRLYPTEDARKAPLPENIPPGGTAIVSWKVELDTAELGGWAGLRNRVLMVRIEHEFKIGGTEDNCLNSFAHDEIPIYIVRDDSRTELICELTLPDSLGLAPGGIGYDPETVAVQGLLRNTGTAPALPGRAVLRLGGMGLHCDPAVDSVRNYPQIPPGASLPLSWTLRPRPRAVARAIEVQMLAIDEREIATRCTAAIAIAGHPALSCAITVPDTVRIDADGHMQPALLPVDLTLLNLLDTLVRDVTARLELQSGSRLELASGELPDRQWSHVQSNKEVTGRWLLALRDAPLYPLRETVRIRYRTLLDTIWRSCEAELVLFPEAGVLQCMLTGDSLLTATDVEAAKPYRLGAVISNTGTLPVDIDRYELRIAPGGASPVAGLESISTLTQAGTTLTPGSTHSLSWDLRAYVLLVERTAVCTVTAYDAADSVLTVCTQTLHIEAVDGLRCAIRTADSVRFHRDPARYEPEPLAVDIDLRDVLDEALSGIEAEIDLTQASRLALASGEPATKTLAMVDSHSTSTISWLLTPLPGSTDEEQQISIRYRSAQETAWKFCEAAVVIEEWPEETGLMCSTAGHDSLYSDQHYERFIPYPLHVSYSVTNTGTVRLTGCEATIIPPPAFALAGSDSTQRFTSPAYGNEPGGPVSEGTLLPGRSCTRWWKLSPTQALTSIDPRQIRWVWASNEQGSAQGCEHTIAIIPDNPSGIELTPLYLRFEAERGGALPADQQVQLWTGGGLVMPWTAVPDAWWLDAQPASGSQATQIAVRPNSTQLAEGMHASELAFAVTPPARSVQVQYIITKSTSAGDPPMAQSLALEVWPQPAAAGGMLQVRITHTGSGAIRLSLYDPLGRERLSRYAESGSVIQLPLSGLAPGLYWLRARSESGVITRAVVLR